MVEEVKKLKMKIVDFNKKQMKERIEKIKVETEKRISEGTVQNRTFSGPDMGREQCQ